MFLALTRVTQDAEIESSSGSSGGGGTLWEASHTKPQHLGTLCLAWVKLSIPPSPHCAQDAEVESSSSGSGTLWVASYDRPPAILAASQICRVLESSYSQRQDRGPSNPHGEHAHDVYEIFDQL